MYYTIVYKVNNVKQFLFSNVIAIPEVPIKPKCIDVKLKYDNLELLLDIVFATFTVQGWRGSDEVRVKMIKTPDVLI